MRLLLLLLWLLHLYVGSRLLPALPGGPWAAALGLGLLLSALTIPLSLNAERRFAPARSRAVAWTGLLCMGWFSSLAVACFLRDVLLLAAHGLAWAGWALPPLDAIERFTAITVPLLALLSSVFGFYQARRTAPVRRVDVPIAGLPAALQGFRIVQISDLHVGPTIRAGYVRRVVDAVNRLDADLVAITGDLVDGSVPALASEVAPLAELQSRHGTFFVTGNHEYYVGVLPWVKALRDLGMVVLLNQHVLLKDCLVLAGVTDFTAGGFEPSHRSDPARALSGAPADAAVRVLLAHQPRSAAAAEAAGFDLQLSGHTHGGQFLPWRWLVPLQQPFVAGLARQGRMWIYTSRGTGYWGPPKRVGAPSEITEIRLIAA